MPRKHSGARKSGKNNSLRIIGGEWRGRKLQFPDLPGLRPTPDRVRETLFNWLAPHIYNARCLDLFAGSGALSLEALSRGASAAVILDQSKLAVKQLQEHLNMLDCNSAELIQADALNWLKQANSNDIKPFDIILLDPPFHQQLITRCCEQIAERGLLNQQGLIYIEAESSYDLVIPDTWQIHRETSAGEVRSYLCTNQS